MNKGISTAKISSLSNLRGLAAKRIEKSVSYVASAGLVGLEPIIDLVKTIVWTGQLRGERPVSAILCAPIGSGKTSVLWKLQSEVTEFFSDFTSREARPALKKDYVTHLLIGDLLSVLGHKQGTVKLSINILAKLTGDRLTRDPWTGDEIAPRMMGVITAIPPEELYSRQCKPFLWSGGFASRYIIVRYDYDLKTIRRIHEYIKSDAYTKEAPYAFHVDRGQLEVAIPPSISDKISLLARTIKHDPIGARAHHHLRALTKARARMRGSVVVNEEDFKAVDEFSEFFSKSGKTI
jgi:hypothetical protein